MPADPAPGRPVTATRPRGHSHAAHWRALGALLILGVPGASLAWLIVAALNASRAGWMALVVAVATVLVLRICQFPHGTTRAALAALATGFGIVMSDWLIAALPIGAAMGQLPFVAACRMGMDFAWTLTQLGSTPLDWFCSGFAVLLAAWLGR